MRRQDLLDLNEALQHPGRTIEAEISTELSEEEDLDLVSPLEGSLTAVSTGNLLLISGRFRARVVVECARCSAPLEKDVEFELDEQFPVEGVPSSFNPREHAVVKAEEPYPLFEGNQLMVEALLRQWLIVSLPTQPLCDFGWDGPCPVAAQLLRRRQEAAETPFAALKKLLPPEDAQE
ncbi:MAG: YceD family protein [Fimbriimonadaceae bacterium]